MLLVSRWKGAYECDGSQRWKICPAGAIAPEKKPLCFDYGRCIRCDCCIEVCPFGALGIIETMTGRIIRSAASLILPPGKTK
jgi:Fe-S-cluster-containing hydrogenase component 2